MTQVPSADELIERWLQEDAGQGLRDLLRTEGYIIVREPTDVRARIGYALFEALGETTGMHELETALSAIMSQLALCEVV